MPHADLPYAPDPLGDDEPPGWGRVTCPTCHAPERHRCMSSDATRDPRYLPRDLPHRTRVGKLLGLVFVARPKGTVTWHEVGPVAWYDAAQAAQEFALDLDLDRSTEIEVAEWDKRPEVPGVVLVQGWVFVVLADGRVREKRQRAT